MGRRRGVMSEELKYELAKDLGFYETVMREGWEGIRTKDAGNMVRRAIQIAEEKLARDYMQQQQGRQQTYQGAGQLRQQPQQPYGGQPNPQPYQQPNPQAYQPLPHQPLHGYSRQSGFAPAYPAYPAYPGFTPPAETNAKSTYPH
jgi:hypothetical protein